MHSGIAFDACIPYAPFLNDWKKVGQWMLLVQPLEHRVNVYESADGRQ
jgi:hypothetical protein